MGSQDVYVKMKLYIKNKSLYTVETLPFTTFIDGNSLMDQLGRAVNSLEEMRMYLRVL